MASRQDQLHSYQFTVQRVVSAVVTGDSDPARSPFRRVGGAVLAGVLLGALTLAGVAVYGVLAPGHGANWTDGGAVIVERESGARYVYLGGQLHPVPNYTSALLVIGSATARTVTVARSTLAGVPRGSALGIPGAPDPLPPADRLLPAPWAVCSARFGDGQVQSILYVGRAPAGGTELGDTAGLLVGVPDGTDYLIWQHTRYRVPRFALGALAWGAENPTPVAAALLNGLAAGPDLAPPVVPGQRGAPSKVPHAVVGQVVTETVPGGGKQYAVALADGLAGVTELQAALLLAQSGTGELPLLPSDFTGHLTGNRLSPTGTGAPPERRPELVHPHAADRGTCATVGGTRDVLAYDVPVTPEGVRVGAPAGLVPTVTADRVVVPAGRGAVVATSGAVSVVSELGVRYPVPSADVLGMLGYGQVTPVALPPALVALLPVGPALDPATARTPAG